MSKSLSHGYINFDEWITDHVKWVHIHGKGTEIDILINQRHRLRGDPNYCKE